MSVSEQTADEFFNSLVGFEEIAIAKAFGRGPLELMSTSKSQGLRALVFIEMRRAKRNPDPEGAAKSMRLVDVIEYFTPPAKSDEQEEAPAAEEPGEA